MLNLNICTINSDIVPYRKGNKWTFKGDIYDAHYFDFVDDFFNNVAIVQKDKRFFLYKRFGDLIEIKNVNNVHRLEKLILGDNNKLFNNQGNLLSTNFYFEIKNNNLQLCGKYILGKNDGDLFLLEDNGNIITKTGYRQIEFINKFGIYKVNTDYEPSDQYQNGISYYNILNSEGLELFSQRFSRIGDFNDYGYAIVQKSDGDKQTDYFFSNDDIFEDHPVFERVFKLGVIHQNGNLIVDCKYESITFKKGNIIYADDFIIKLEENGISQIKLNKIAYNKRVEIINELKYQKIDFSSLENTTFKYCHSEKEFNELPTINDYDKNENFIILRLYGGYYIYKNEDIRYGFTNQFNLYRGNLLLESFDQIKFKLETFAQGFENKFLFSYYFFGLKNELWYLNQFNQSVKSLEFYEFIDNILVKNQKEINPIDWILVKKTELGFLITMRNYSLEEICFFSINLKNNYLLKVKYYKINFEKLEQSIILISTNNEKNEKKYFLYYLNGEIILESNLEITHEIGDFFIIENKGNKLEKRIFHLKKGILFTLLNIQITPFFFNKNHYSPKFKEIGTNNYTEIEYLETYHFVKIHLNSKYGLLDLNGNIVLDILYDELIYKETKYIETSIGDLKGIFNIQNKKKLPAFMKSIIYYEDLLIAIMEFGGFIVFTQDLNEVFSCQYNFKYKSHGYIFCTHDRESFLFDKNGKIIINEIFEKISILEIEDCPKFFAGLRNGDIVFYNIYGKRISALLNENITILKNLRQYRSDGLNVLNDETSYLIMTNKGYFNINLQIKYWED